MGVSLWGESMQPYGMAVFMKSHLLALLLATVLLLPFARPSWAQEQAPESLALDDMIVHLLDTHERIQAARASVDSAEAQAEQAFTDWYPNLDLVVQGGYEAIDKTIQSESDRTATSKMRNEQDLTLTQTIYDFGATSGNVAVYRALSQEARARLEQTRQDLMTQGVLAYLTVIRGRETLKYAVRSEKNIKRLSGMQEALVERGAGLSYEELQVKGQLAGAQALVVNTQRALQTALNDFRSVYGFTLSEEEVARLKMPKAPLPLIPGSLEECIAVSETENPYLAELRHAVVRTEGQAKAVDAAFYPDLEFVGEHMRKEQDQGVQGVRYETRGTVQMTYNLYNGGGDTDAARAARSDVTAARKTVYDSRRSVEENVRNAWLDLTTLKKNVDLYENQANITWEFLALVKKKKAMGAEVGLLDILVGERDYINAISAKVGAEIDYNIAAYTLLYQMGRMDLDAVSQ